MNKRKINLKGKSLARGNQQSRAETIIILFDAYLKNQRGLSENYRKQSCNIGRLFLKTRFESGAIHLNQIKANDIMSFVYHYARSGSPSRTQHMASSLRSFLQFLKFKNFVVINFTGVVPSVAMWKQDRIPNFLTEQEVKILLKHCEIDSSIGLRDYTILRLLLSLGLRACEVAHLMLSDFDWTNGELIICGKGSKVSRLPIMEDLGNDLVRYLLQGRPSCSSKNLFVSVIQPFQGLTSRSITHIVKVALERAGLRKRGAAHLLRHTLATQLLNKGASLQEVGQVLRHQSIDTTAIYAKVDFNRLRTLALSWPGKLKFGGSL